jgi:5-methylcytosine-specific restriction endonuclease McrA
MCAICSEPVDRLLRYPDPMCASLEHRIPVSKGGRHTRANCACAHLRCNVQKGDRSAWPKTEADPAAN